MLDVLILCAGSGTRLMPLTIDTPKPLLRLTDQESILSRLVQQVSGRVNSIYINVSYLAEQFLVGIPSEISGRCHFIWEPRVLGSHNTLKCVSKLSSNGILVIHGDLVLSNIDVESLIERINYDSDQSLLVVHRRKENSARSIVKLDESGIVTEFEEITQPRSSREECLSNSGIYYFSRSSLASPELRITDSIGQDLTPVFLPSLIKQRKLLGYIWSSRRHSIDSKESLDAARQLIQIGRL
jgi:NDP-sugar pyrophosphorylase family protein